MMKTDVNAIKSGAPLTSGVVGGYVSTDFFIQALKKAGANPTPESVQKAASTMTYELKGLAGPTKYPQSHVVATPACQALVLSDGTANSVIAPYGCSTKTYPVLKKFRG